MYQVLLDALRWRSMDSFDQKYAYVLEHYLSSSSTDHTIEEQKYPIDYQYVNDENKQVFFPGKSENYDVGIVNIPGNSDDIAISISQNTYTTPQTIRAIQNDQAKYQSQQDALLDAMDDILDVNLGDSSNDEVC